MSIRPGWFYHLQEDSLVKKPEALFQLYLKSAGRGASLLLNVPPDRRGLINEHDSIALVGFKKLCDESFSKNVISKKFPLTYESNYKINIGSTKKINCIVLREPVQFGQRVKNFSVQLKKENKTVKEIEGTTIGRKRILTFDATDADAIEIIINDSKAKPLLSEASVYLIDEKLIEKE